MWEAQARLHRLSRLLFAKHKYASPQHYDRNARSILRTMFMGVNALGHGVVGSRPSRRENYTYYKHIIRTGNVDNATRGNRNRVLL